MNDGSNPQPGDLISLSDSFCAIIGIRFDFRRTYVVLNSFMRGGKEALRLLRPDGTVGFDTLDSIRSNYVVLSRVDP